MTIFSTAEEQQREPLEIGGKVLFYPDFALRTAGGDVSVVAPWKSYVLQDRELISGQNPFSDEALLKLLLPALNGRSSMNSVQIEQKSYEMPPREGISIAHFLTVADIERSARYYEKVFGARILSLGDGNAPAYLQLANIWMILNVGGGPTPDKPTVTLSVPDPNHINSFMNFRVADIQACYELWKSRGAEFITEPIPKYGEIRCYIRDPDGYIIEVGQSTDLKYG